jgi:DNA primase
MKPKEKDLKQEDILYFKTFPKINSKVYLVEGEFDAMSLNAIGLFGAACGGKNLSESQIEIMRSFIPVLALDNDEEGKDWGLQALLDIGDKLLISGFKEVYFVRPPKGFKDWNALLQKHSVETIQQYIKKFESPYNEWTRNQLVMKTL